MRSIGRKYLDMRSEEIASGNDEHPKATAYYKANQAIMDAGATIGWPHRKFAHELTAIQHAVNLRADNPDTFDAEYQNTPRSASMDSGAMRTLSSDEFCLRVLPTHRRAEVPQWAEWITLGVDVQQSSLWWSVAAIGEDFSGSIIDYGVWPDQGVDYITLSDVDRTIAKATKITHPSEAAIEALRRFMHERFAQPLHSRRRQRAQDHPGDCRRRLFVRGRVPLHTRNQLPNPAQSRQGCNRSKSPMVARATQKGGADRIRLADPTV